MGKLISDSVKHDDLESTFSRSVAQWSELLPETAICARRRYRLSSVKCDTPLLIVPLSGSKNIHYSSRIYSGSVGGYLMLHHAMDVEVENVPTESKQYLAWTIDFPWRLIELARQIIAVDEVFQKAIESVEEISSGYLSSEIYESLEAYLTLLRNGASRARFDHSLLGILIALHNSGVSQFLVSRDPSISAQIRLMVSKHPRKAWRSIDFEAVFHMSGATLRRRLLKESTSLRSLIREARLHVALTLLQTSRKPIAKVAEECGYRSLSSFREGFKEQFCVDPQDVSNV